jgi:glutamate dehydrogenase/leucine dehydrogenase
MEIKGARIAVQGFGSVGKAAARFLSERGAILVAASDTGGAIYNPDGIDVMHLVETKLDTDSVVNYAQGKRLTADEIFGLDADILIPAATADVINERNVSAIKARLILQGANIPATAAAEKALHERGVLSVPDFIANAGGVIMAAMEYEKRTEKEAFAAIEERIKKNTALILDKMKKECKLPRDAARELAMERVIHAEKFREF